MDIEPMMTPGEVARAFGCSERTMRAKARELGACHIVGKSMILTAADVQIILEATRPRPSRPTSEVKTTGARLPEGDYAALRAQMTRQAVKRPRMDRRKAR